MIVITVRLLTNRSSSNKRENIKRICHFGFHCVFVCVLIVTTKSVCHFGWCLRLWVVHLNTLSNHLEKLNCKISFASHFQDESDGFKVPFETDFQLIFFASFFPNYFRSFSICTRCATDHHFRTHHKVDFVIAQFFCAFFLCLFSIYFSLVFIAIVLCVCAWFKRINDFNE